MWELDHKERWALRNWCFWTLVLEKTLESPLKCKEIKPVNPKGNQSWIFTGRTDAEAEAPVLWPLDVKNLLLGKDPHWRRPWHPTPVFLPRKSHGWRSLDGCSPWGHWRSDTTEWLHFHFSLSCIGGGNSNPLQCSCLENPRDGGAWWAAVYGVAQSQTWLKWLRSSSKDPYAGKYWGQEEKGTTEDKMVGWHHQLDGQEF